MHASNQPVFARHDTFFGVCEAIGQDMGFNPNYLRLAFALAILPAPVAVISGYIALGVLVMVSRLLFPIARKGTRAAEAMTTVQPALPEGQNDRQEVALAA
ncbi:MAG: PspC domain-containing protein [Rhizorhabdus sp.]